MNRKQREEIHGEIRLQGYLIVRNYTDEVELQKIYRKIEALKAQCGCGKCQEFPGKIKNDKAS